MSKTCSKKIAFFAFKCPNSKAAQAKLKVQKKDENTDIERNKA